MYVEVQKVDLHMLSFSVVDVVVAFTRVSDISRASASASASASACALTSESLHVKAVLSIQS